MLEKAVRICGATFGNISRWDGEVMHLVATNNAPRAFAEARRLSPDYRPGSKTIFARLIATNKLVHISDLAADSVYIDERFPAAVSAVELFREPATLHRPSLRQGRTLILRGGNTQWQVSRSQRAQHLPLAPQTSSQEPTFRD